MNIVGKSTLNQRVLGGPQSSHGVVEVVFVTVVVAVGSMRCRDDGGRESSSAFRCTIMTKLPVLIPVMNCIVKVKMMIAQAGSLVNGRSVGVYLGNELSDVGFGSDRQETFVMR